MFQSASKRPGRDNVDKNTSTKEPTPFPTNSSPLLATPISIMISRFRIRSPLTATSARPSKARLYLRASGHASHVLVRIKTRWSRRAAGRESLAKRVSLEKGWHAELRNTPYPAWILHSRSTISSCVGRKGLQKYSILPALRRNEIENNGKCLPNQTH
jgi:hypothetical protein